MELKQLQELVARLATDTELRTRFAADPDAVAREAGLNDADTRQLRRLAPKELEFFARTLEIKGARRHRERTLWQRCCAFFTNR